MKAYFFLKTDEGLKHIGDAKTKDPRKEFRLLARKEHGDPLIYRAHKRTPPDLSGPCVLGTGRSVDEAKHHIIMTKDDV